MVRLRFRPWMFVGLAACPGNDATTTDDTTGSGHDTMLPTGGETTDSADTTDTGETTGGEVSGAARVVYISGEGGFDAWPYFVDCRGATPGPPTPIHPLTSGWVLDQLYFSNRGEHGGMMGASSPMPLQPRWLSYSMVDEQGAGHGQWMVRMDGSLPGTPIKVGLPDAFVVVGVEFSADEQLVAFAVEPTGNFEEQALYVCALGADGSCEPEPWHLPIVPGGFLEAAGARFSPDGSRIAYASDPQNSGTRQLYLAGTAPGDGGTAVQVTDLMPPVRGAGRPRFAADGATLYFSVSEAIGVPGQIVAVDISVDPPATPVEVSPPGNYVFNDGVTGMLSWEPGKIDNYGDLSLVKLAGTKASPAMPVHNKVGHVKFDSFAWAPDGQWIVYSADSAGAPGLDEIYAVDVSGPAPGPPVNLAGPVGVAEEVIMVRFAPDAGRVFVPARVSVDGPSDLWMAGLAPLTPPILLHPPGFGVLGGGFAVSPASDLVAVHGMPKGATEQELLLVDLAAPTSPVGLGGALAPGEATSSTPIFAADGQRVFFQVRAGGGWGPAYQVDVDPPGAPIRISADGHRVGTIYVLGPPL